MKKSSFLLGLVFLFWLTSLFSFLIPKNLVYSLTQQDCENLPSEDVNDRIRCWEDLLGETSSRKKSLESEVVKFDSRIALTGTRIAQALIEIQNLEEEITQLDSRINLLDLSLDEISALLIGRVRATYKKQKVNPLLLLFSSSDFSQFVSRYKYFRATQLHDRKLLIQMETARINYGQQRDLKEEKQAESESLKAVLEEEKTVLAAQKRGREHLLETTKSDERTFQQLLATARAEKEAIEQAMAAGLGALEDGSPIGQGETIALVGNSGAPCCSTGTHLHFEVRKNGNPQNPAGYLKEIGVAWDNSPDDSFSFTGSWEWPIDNPRITQGFGMTYWARLGWYGGSDHNGIDMINDGHLIRAPQGGTLYKGQTICGSGCPIKFVAIDHGDELISWYWHVQ